MLRASSVSVSSRPSRWCSGMPGRIDGSSRRAVCPVAKSARRRGLLCRACERRHAGCAIPMSTGVHQGVRLRTAFGGSSVGLRGDPDPALGTGLTPTISRSPSLSRFGLARPAGAGALCARLGRFMSPRCCRSGLRSWLVLLGLPAFPRTGTGAAPQTLSPVRGSRYIPSPSERRAAVTRWLPSGRRL